MNETETKSDLGPVGQAVVQEMKQRPAGYKKWHRWQWGWLKWLAFVDFVERMWPRNA